MLWRGIPVLQSSWVKWWRMLERAGEGRFHPQAGPRECSCHQPVVSSGGLFRRTRWGKIHPCVDGMWWGCLCAATEPSCVLCRAADQPGEHFPFTRPRRVKNEWLRVLFLFFSLPLEVFCLWVLLEGKNRRNEMIQVPLVCRRRGYILHIFQRAIYQEEGFVLELFPWCYLLLIGWFSSQYYGFLQKPKPQELIASVKRNLYKIVFLTKILFIFLFSCGK